jgi:hypothetical protein
MLVRFSRYRRSLKRRGLLNVESRSYYPWWRLALLVTMRWSAGGALLATPGSEVKRLLVAITNLRELQATPLQIHCISYATTGICER